MRSLANDPGSWRTRLSLIRSFAEGRDYQYITQASLERIVSDFDHKALPGTGKKRDYTLPAAALQFHGILPHNRSIPLSSRLYHHLECQQRSLYLQQALWVRALMVKQDSDELHPAWPITAHFWDWTQLCPDSYSKQGSYSQRNDT